MGLKGDLGQAIVAYELMRNGWHVYSNYGSMIKSNHERQGVDIIARKGRREVRVEVKLRDRSNSPHTNTGQVHITESEFGDLTHLALVLLDRSKERGESVYPSYVVPRRLVKKYATGLTSGGYRLSISKIKKHNESFEYL
jgi:Holliday junction resolvase-like predicted endonuclease